ncbi:TetR/AcrR family transcriptional regulator [Salibacterium salarium]|uniref:TetR/AcrR family transcriptional regulator n=1 Tax=Salibacterium salarium TaxID=284579 RepID=A0A428N4G0_9BACI|nr:TetR/AcrR family transcriptional regulator [Salibacterium salarium]RSL33370.1 TetR/AcrR family transcriptional regulator [Salibacterium salarium]
MDKHENIIVTALRLFSEKGYFSTSVQEIVSYCGISKGSFYNYFASKEDLLIEVFRYNHQQMLWRAKNVNLDQSLSPKEQLIKKIKLELEGLYNNREFFLLLHKVVPIHENKKLLPLMKKTKAAMISWHKEWLMEVYGEKIIPQIWDHVLFLQGAMKEYITLIKENNETGEPELFAKEIIAKLDVLVEHGSHLNPVLTNKLMQEYEEMVQNPEKKTKEEERDETLTALKSKIDMHVTQDQEKQELMESVQCLEEEFKQQVPRSFLMKAMISFLKENPLLKNDVYSLEQFIK